MVKTKTVKMPAGIRNKLMAAIAMLLVSSIMMVSSTYAWFTLSTAPEVTGITTSVGANGNLEIALLTTETYADMAKITSAVGDSSAATNTTVEEANITWGNLVDLSAAGYGLTGISLMPAAVNGTYTTTGEGEDAVTTLTNVSPANPLLTAVYGADGRVSTVDGQTVSAVAAANGAFAYGDSQTYGVRAVGVTSNLSAREISFNSARSTVRAAVNSAKAGTTSAINNNMGALINFAALETVPANFSTEDIAAFLAIANGVVADLAVLENGYKNAAVAYAAATAENDEEFAAAKLVIDAASLATLAAEANKYGLNAAAMTALAAAQTNAGNAKTFLAGADSTTAGTEVKAAIELLVGTPVQEGTNVYIATGAIGQLGAQLGTFELASVGGIGTAYAGASDSVATGTYNSTVDVVNGLTPTFTASGASNITDTYGYIIDFAFRTNATGSNLQLQTTGVNRVYTEQTDVDLATQGAGSTVTYAFAAEMTETQVNKLLGAIRLVFLDTTTGAVHATASLTDIDVGDTEATAKVKLTGQDGDVGTIVPLEQNVAKAVSVLVYMDGDQVDNTAVINAQTSGSLNLNLQFSSSAELVPMQNTALQTMKAYTVSFNANGGAGIMPDVRVAGDYTVPAAANFTAPSGKQFAGWATAADGTVIAAPITVEENTTLYAIWTDAPAAGGDSGSGEDEGNETTTYTVTIGNAESGTASANPASAAAGTQVTLTAVADAGYEFTNWLVTGNDVDLSGQGATATFTMPEANVEITPVFTATT